MEIEKSNRNSEINAEFVLKTTPPRLGRSVILRKQLSFESADVLRDKTVIEVVAPTGFGKTSLLLQWRREFLQQGHLVAWLSLDARDDSYRFIKGIAHAMRVACGRASFGQSIDQAVRQASGGIDGVTAWLAEVVNVGTETTLILDEGHYLSEETRQETLVYLILNAPSNLKIILSSRTRLHLPISELSARGKYFNINAEMMRFSSKDTRNILENRFPKQLNEAIMMRIFEKTDGWPLGLQLAIAYLEKQPSISAAVETLSAASTSIEQYFVECLYNGLNSEQTKLLLAISLLDSFNYDLIIHITGEIKSQELLQDLVENTPIFSEIQDSGWMRLHPMAREFFRKQLDDKATDESRILHQRAAEWLAAQNLLEEAALHALSAGQKKLAYQLIGDDLYQVMVRGHQMHVLFWLDRLPAEEVERQPRIILGAAWALAESERNQQAISLIDKLLSNPFISAKERLEANIILGTAAHFGDRIDECVDIYSKCEYSESLNSSFLRALTLTSQATVKIYQAKPEQTRHLLRSAQPFISDNMMALRGYGDWLMGFSYLWEGQVVLAQDVLYQSLVRTEEKLGRRSAVSVKIASALAMATWESGDSERAEEILANRLDILEQVSAPEAIVIGYQVAARVAANKGQLRRAIDLLENLIAIGESRNNVRYCISSLCEQIRMYVKEGLVDNCQSTLKRINVYQNCPEVKSEGLLAPLLNLRLQIAKAYVAIANKQWQIVLDVLVESAELAQKIRRGREVVEIKMLIAFAYQRLGFDGQELGREAMQLANVYGLKRTPFENFPNLFNALRIKGNYENTNEQKISENIHSPPRLVSKQSGLLTSKEMEILQLLAKSMSNKRIALALDVSEETIKWHIKNLFSKLNAISRRNVVDRAMMLGILEINY